MEEYDDQIARSSSLESDVRQGEAFEPEFDSAFLFENPSRLDEHLLSDYAPKIASPSEAFERVEFMGLNFHKAGAKPLLAALLKSVGGAQFKYVVTPNVDHVVTVARSAPGSDIRLAYDDADFVVCDSRILSLMSRTSSIDLEPVPGSDITRELLEQLPHGETITVIGGKKDLHHSLLTLYPHFKWAFMTPPMGVRHSARHQDAICDFIASTQSSVTFLAIGAPQSEIVCRKMKLRGDGRGLSLCIGASLQFLTGEKKRAPAWVQKAHGEWLFRLICEPSRLAHRYLVKGPQIIVEWIRWRKTQQALVIADLARNSACG